MKDGRLEVGGELYTVGRVDVNHLYFASKVFSVREGTHHGEAIAEDEAVRPIYVVLVKIDGFAIILLRVGKEFALDRFGVLRPSEWLWCSRARGYATQQDQR